MSSIIVEETGLPLHFPDPRAEAKARAEEFRRLKPERRWREITALMAMGLNMARSSPRRDFIEKRWQAQEADWQRLQKTLFSQHAE